MELILNELSAIQAPSLPEARAAMSSFVAVLVRGTAIGFERAIRASIDLGGHLLTAGYPVARWRNDPEVDQDERTFFRLITARFPVDHGLADLRNALLGREYRYQGRPCVGLGAADVVDTVCISFALAEEWNSDRITVHHGFLNEATGEYEQDQVIVLHASAPTHMAAHEQWFVDRQRVIVSGTDLYERRDELLPELVFCEEAASQLATLTAGHAMLHPVAKKLFSFQDYASTWNDGPFDPKQLPMKATPESESTMNEFGRDRDFKMPTGALISLPWHVRLTGLPWRIHFGWDVNNRTIIVGYIGRHLPTSKYRT
jgi:hypothetical protein